MQRCLQYLRQRTGSIDGSFDSDIETSPIMRNEDLINRNINASVFDSVLDQDRSECNLFELSEETWDKMFDTLDNDELAIDTITSDCSNLNNNEIVEDILGDKGDHVHLEHDDNTMEGIVELKLLTDSRSRQVDSMVCTPKRILPPA